MEYLRARRSLFLSGGGLKVLQFLGALDVLGPRGFEQFTGVSAGGLTCLLLSLGLTCDAATRALAAFDVPGTLRSEFDVRRLCRTGAPLDGVAALRKLQAALAVLGCPPDADFAWHARVTGRRLRIVAADVASARLVAFSTDSTPSAPLAHAVMAGMALPLVLPPVIIGGRSYVDAAVLNNCPLHLAGSPTHLLALVTHMNAGAALAGINLRCCLAEAASVIAARADGALVLEMPSVPPEAHALRVGRGDWEELLGQGRAAMCARALSSWLAGALVLAVLARAENVPPRRKPDGAHQREEQHPGSGPGRARNAAPWASSHV